jgi:hypothetical protein
VRYAEATFLKRLLEDLSGGPSKWAERIQILEGVTRAQREKAPHPFLFRHSHGSAGLGVDP